MINQMDYIKYSMLLIGLFIGAYISSHFKRQADQIAVEKKRTQLYVSNITQQDSVFMQTAVHVGYRYQADNINGPSGAIIVKNDMIVGEGWDQTKAKSDPTAHAVIQAIKDASARLNTLSLNGATLYTTHQPCTICLAVLYDVGVDRVYYSVPLEGEDESRGKHILQNFEKHPSMRVIPEITLQVETLSSHLK
jgi:tRNA(Arg) A34 adenosine deaminase TadA